VERGTAAVHCRFVRFEIEKCHAAVRPPPFSVPPAFNSDQMLGDRRVAPPRRLTLSFLQIPGVAGIGSAANETAAGATLIAEEADAPKNTGVAESNVKSSDKARGN
jgi:hypothetical protein